MATKHDPRSDSPRRSRGLTLLELLSVLAVTAVVAATAAPALSALIDARRLDSAATRLAADLQFVRGEAISRNRPLRLSVLAGTGASCWIVHTGALADCSCGMTSGAVCGGTARTIKAALLPAGERVSVAANVSSILFDPLHGTSTPTATLRLIGAHGAAVHHIVNVVGRVRSCSPEGVVPGYAAC